MNTETTGQQAEVTADAADAADAAVDAVETVTYRYSIGEEIFSGMQDDAAEGVAALKLLMEALPDLMTLYRLKWGNLDADANAVYIRMENALDACRAVGGAR